MINFEIVKLYHECIYVGWQTKKPKRTKGKEISEAYFIKIVDDSGKNKYFMLGEIDKDDWYVYEG